MEVEEDFDTIDAHKLLCKDAPSPTES